MLVTAHDERDLEVFLSVLGAHVGRSGATTTIDLYADDDLPEEAEAAFRALRDRADAEPHEGERSFPLRRLLNRPDPYMGREIDLTDEADLRRFALLAHRVIHCESWSGNRQLLSASGPYTPLWLGLGDGEARGLVDAARRAGAGTLRIVDAGD
ncbi:MULTISPECIES: hypothetical protein [Streptomyces]|uniref:Uncharacterized protein n=1 Tax=Streptomyces sudanensis TaxID=436397 RepID=A0ABY4TI47_9ACTN|nr:MULTISPECIES: hypothetical protein [Streptomyces]URN17296.1 hypothetical protein MW084_16725 [Streptomyces sudanensis]